MAHYIVLVNWTDQGIRSVKDSPKRAEAFRKAVQRVRGKVTIYYTLGQYDIVAILEAPDDATVMSLALAVGSLGNVRTSTLKAFSEAEAKEIIGKLS